MSSPKTDSASARYAAILVMAKMALIDDNFSKIEQMFLAATAGTTTLEQLLDEAREASLESLCRRVERYEDRFFIAFRAFSMAYIDQQLDSREQHLFDQLVELLGITPEDRRLIEQARSEGQVDDPPPPNPRIQALFNASSFAESTSA